MPPIALLSVYDKSGVAELAAGLHRLGWRVLSSGGTAEAVAAAGVPVTEVAELTGVPAILGHRVVTLHPMVHGGILADLDDPGHRADLAQHGIEPITLVVVNLYPFGDRPGIDTIDIGGPAMVRAAAKNHAHVGVVVDPSDYGPVLVELEEHGALRPATRCRLARKAFAQTAAYDAAIVTWLDRTDPDGAPVLPDSIHLALERAQPLRYGENPHQLGARYRAVGAHSWWDAAEQLGGKELSYLNVFDAEAAWRLVHRLGPQPAAVVVKHANPCGAAVAGDITSAYRRAHEGDPVSAFGGIVALNRPVPRELAEALAPVFTEVVVAPAFDEDALAVLTAKKNLRLLVAGPPGEGGLDFRGIDGGLLVQEADVVTVDRAAWEVVTKVAPTEEQWADLELAWRVVAAVSSNAIVVVRGGQAVGIGAGQQNRLDSARIAVEKAGERAVGGVGASDAFFPFRDGLDALAAAGVTAVIQPGGSVRDAEVVAAADEHGMAMVVTGERHFRH
jgi:phosphoribosylaminoimidazolecarboxamide formyltransferase/IMP cyclohydrolase